MLFRSAQSLGRDKVEGLARAVLGELKPDLTIVLDLPVESGLARERAKDRYARMGEEFHRTVRDAFLDIAKREPGRCVVIDASQPIEAVSGAIARAVQQRLL